ncbi:MAG: sulfatase-like hydrolase/transferase [Acidobacteriota bacterium]|nr:sulfatase-like hydrolase/transferase [Acidobacteriota bacterium]
MGTYGVFDGRGIDWSQFGLRGWMDASLWVLVLAAGLRFSHHLIRITSQASWTLIGLQSVLMLALSLTSEGGMWWKEHTPRHRVPAELLDYSSSRNIVHIILDSFQTDIFRELVVEQQLEDDLEGFVLFEDNMGVAPYTSFSIPAIFSGQIFDGKQLPGSYYRESVRKGFQNRLHDDGYKVNLVPLESMRDGKYTNYYRIPRVYMGSPEDVVQLSAAHLMDVALFRQLPHWARYGVYNDNNWLITPLVAGHRSVSSFQKKAFFNDYAGNVFVGDSQPAYHFLHLIPPHPPYVTRDDGSYAGRVLPNTRENYRNEARAILKLFLKLLNRLKELNLYDSSLIVLQGDHGSQIPPVIDGETIETCVPRLAALLTMKLPGSSGALTVSRAQTSLLDIAATIMKASGVDGGFPGRPIFEISPREARSRPFVTYRTSTGEPELTKYLITGSVFDPAACHGGEPVAVLRTRPQYEFGTDITFGLLGNADDFLGFGWSSPMSNGCWNNGHNSSLKIKLAVPENDLLLKATLRPYIKPEVPEQQIHVLANGTEIDLWSAGKQQVHQFRAVIPKALIHSPDVEIAFHLPNAVSPRSIGAGGDRRQLAILMRSLSLHPWPDYRYGTEIRFGRNGNAEAFMGRGWSKSAEDNFRWTSGHLASLHIPVPVPQKDLTLQAVLRPFLREERVPKQTIRVLANRNKVGEWTATERKTHTLQATIPKELVDSRGVTIEFDLPDAISPKSIDGGRDVRKLAAAMVRVSLNVKDR